MREIIYLDLSKAANRVAGRRGGRRRPRRLDRPGPGAGHAQPAPPATGRSAACPSASPAARKAVVAVQADPKPGSDLVKEVTIPVGAEDRGAVRPPRRCLPERRAARCALRSIVKYKDGTTASWQFWPFPDSVVDWQAEPVRDFGEFQDNPFTTAALDREGRAARAKARSTAASGFSTAPSTTCPSSRSPFAAARTAWA